MQENNIKKVEKGKIKKRQKIKHIYMDNLVRESLRPMYLLVGIKVHIICLKYYQILI